MRLRIDKLACLESRPPANLALPPLDWMSRASVAQTNQPTRRACQRHSRRADKLDKFYARTLRVGIFNIQGCQMKDRPGLLRVLCFSRGARALAAR